MSCLSWRGIFHGSWENKSKFQIGGLRETGGLHPFSPVRAHLLTTPKGQWYLPLASRALSEGDCGFCGSLQTIKKIIIHAPDKSGGKRRQTVEIIFNFVDEVEIPVLAEPMIAESTLGRRKTA